MSMMWFKHNCCSGEYYLFTPYRTSAQSSDGDHKMVVTSSNEVGEEHEYDVIELQQISTQHTSTA